MNMDFTNYANMGDCNVKDEYTPNESVNPSEELFKRIYISGSNQKEDEYTKERLFPGMLQIEGTKNNLDVLYIMPYYKRQVLINLVKNGKYDAKKCFSYAVYDDEGNQLSTSGFFCPQNSEGRKQFQWCRTCKTNFIIAGFLVDSEGSYIMDANKKPLNVFIKGAGSKVGDIMAYSFDCQKLEVPFLFENNSKESDNWERNYSNMFRRIIRVTAGEADTYKGPNTPPNAPDKRAAYILEGHIELDKDKVSKLIDYSKNIDDKLKEKFDFSEKTISSCKKNFRSQLNSFQHSEEFKMNNPTFVPENNSISNAPDFMTVDEPSSPVQQTIADTSSVPDSNISGIGDIPF